MYKIIVIFYLLTVLLSCKQDDSGVRIKGELKNFAAKVSLENQSLEGSLLAEKITFELNEENRFELTLELEKPCYYRLGRNTLYLSPGDDIQIFCDYNDPMAAVFIGEGAEANMYLRSKPFSKGGSYLQSGNMIKDDPSLEELIKRVDKKVRNRLKELDEVRGVSDRFRKLERGRVKFDAINSLLYYPVYLLADKKIPGAERSKLWKETLAFFENDIRAYLDNIVSSEYLEIDIYRDICRTCLPYLSNKNVIAELEDFIQTRMYLAALEGSGLTAGNTAQKENVLKNLRLDYYKEIIAKGIKQYDHLTPGKSAPDVRFKSLEGESVKLSDFKGKLLLIDVWATWCGPCIQESPYFEKLADKFTDEEVEFIAVSIDPNEKTWKKYLNKHPKKTSQFITSKEELAPFHVQGIPRIMVIDKNGLIVDAFATRPSDPKLEELIKSKL